MLNEWYEKNPPIAGIHYSMFIHDIASVEWTNHDISNIKGFVDL